MDADEILDEVTGALDTLVAAGERHDGLFPSIADRETGALLETFPETIPGQRDNLRAFRGSNLSHDHPVLRALDALAVHDDREEYATAVDRYVETFAARCTDTATGIFAWGDHCFWHLDADEPGNSYEQAPASEAGFATHDHLRAAPAWLWERLHQSNPACVQRFADGLDYHWRGADRREYDRHAPIVERRRNEPEDDRAYDFPRHGGHYVLDWACAHAKLPRDRPRQQIEKMLDYWWTERNEWDLLPLESRGRTDEISPGQTLAYAISLFEAADVLANADLAPELVETLREHAETYVGGFLAAPHDLDEKVLLVACRERDLREGVFEPRTGPDVTNELTSMTGWGSVYGGVGDVVAKRGLQACAAYRHTGDDRLLEWAVAAGDLQREDPFPEEGVTEPSGVEAGSKLEGGEVIPIIAGDAGQALGLYLDLYDFTGESRWHDAAHEVAELAVDVYLDGPLPRGAATLDYYDSQLKPAYLLYNLTRLAILDREGVDVGPDYTDR